MFGSGGGPAMMNLMLQMVIATMDRPIKAAMKTVTQATR
jgi:hypothetical protein